MNKTYEVVVNTHQKMLIIGKGANNFSVGEIRFEKDPNVVRSEYGQSDLSDAFALAKAMGAPYVFVMNVRKNDDYFKALDLVKVQDFAYVAFASLYLSDTFVTAYDGGLQHYYFSYFLGTMGLNNLTTIIATDKHAVLYENVDKFITDMNKIVENIKAACTSRAAKQNLICVGNNLSSTKYGAVALAASLCTADVKDYPSIDIGDAVFDIDHYDNPGDWAYFKQHADGSITIENLLNIVEGGPDKVVFFNRILNYIRRGIDFSEYRGKPYTKYRKLCIMETLKNYLEELHGVIIQHYEIMSVKAYRPQDETGVVEVKTYFQVWPIGCLESCQIEKGVDLI